VLSAVLVGAAVLSTSSATAAPKPTIAEAKATIQKLNDQQEQASEDYNEAGEKLKSVDVRLDAAQARLAGQREDLKQAKVRMGQIASETYRRGELSTLGVVLGRRWPQPGTCRRWATGRPGRSSSSTPARRSSWPPRRTSPISGPRPPRSRPR